VVTGIRQAVAALEISSASERNWASPVSATWYPARNWVTMGSTERAAAESPFGGPIGHGFLTLSLFVPMWSQILLVTDVTMGVNYGLNKVRFPAPVPVGSRIALTATLLEVEEVKGGGLQLTVGGVIEREGSEKPVCVLESLTRLYG